MSFWDNLPPAAKNLRLLDPIIGWVKYEDVLDDEGKITAKGSHVGVDAALTAGLNSTNLSLLAGVGASFCANNGADGNPIGRIQLLASVNQKQTKLERGIGTHPCVGDAVFLANSELLSALLSTSLVGTGGQPIDLGMLSLNWNLKCVWVLRKSGTHYSNGLMALCMMI